MRSRIRSTKQDTQTAARLKTLEKKASVLKAELLERLAKTPIVVAAINACGIGRSTYYKWRHDDPEFAKLTDKAISAGRTFVNDIALSKLMQRIDEGHLTALIFWLKNNHAWFSEVVRHEHEHTHEHHLAGDGILTDEMREHIARAAKLTGMTMTLQSHQDAKKKFQASPSEDVDIAVVPGVEEHSSVTHLKDEIQKLTKPQMTVAEVKTNKPDRKVGKKQNLNIKDFLKLRREKGL